MMRILLVEDNEDDALLLQMGLRRYFGELYCHRVDSPEQLITALQQEEWHVVLSDYNLPLFRPGETFGLFKAQQRLIPFILVTGAIGEEAAVALLKAGVNDFVLKHNLAKLPLTIELAIRQCNEQRAKIAAEDALRAAKAELELRVAERTRELANSNEELRATMRQLESTQQHLLQSEKLASIGQLAAGVAHEINNPLGFVIANMHVLNDYTRLLEQFFLRLEQLMPHIPAPQVDEIRRLQNEIALTELRADLPALMSESTDGLNRVKKIVRDLRDFSRSGSDEEWQETELRQLLDSTLNIVRNDLKYKAELICEYGETPPLRCLPSQLNQVFLNLLVNAGHAIGDKGRIHVRTTCQNNEVIVEIEDNGCGIAPEHLSQIFDPFFTTKPVGQGTGLGLSLAYGIMQKHSGHIEVDSVVGRGTRFRLRLPLSTPTP